MNVKKMMIFVSTLALMCALAACSSMCRGQVSSKTNEKMASTQAVGMGSEQKNDIAVGSTCTCGADSKCQSGGVCTKEGCACTGATKDADNMQKFPAFDGKDLDGIAVKSGELFSGNAVTVVNFWFTTCGPCVGELAELDALNKELNEKGGALIGINVFTLDGDESAILDAKKVLSQKGASYQNIYFDSNSEAGAFAGTIYAYPTTYVINRSGSIVGEPIVGAVTSKTQMEALMALIDKAIAADIA